MSFSIYDKLKGDARDGEAMKVVITDVHIPFGYMVGIIFKVMIATIPAVLMASLFWFVFGALFMALFPGKP